MSTKDWLVIGHSIYIKKIDVSVIDKQFEKLKDFLVLFIDNR